MIQHIVKELFQDKFLKDIAYEIARSLVNMMGTKDHCQVLSIRFLLRKQDREKGQMKN